MKEKEARLPKWKLTTGLSELDPARQCPRCHFIELGNEGTCATHTEEFRAKESNSRPKHFKQNDWTKLTWKQQLIGNELLLPQLN